MPYGAGSPASEACTHAHIHSVCADVCAVYTAGARTLAKTGSSAIKGRKACGAIRVVIVKSLKVSAKHSRTVTFFQRGAATHISLLCHSADEVRCSSGMSSQKQCISALDDSQTQPSPPFVRKHLSPVHHRIVGVLFLLDAISQRSSKGAEPPCSFFFFLGRASATRINKREALHLAP